MQVSFAYCAFVPSEIRGPSQQNKSKDLISLILILVSTNSLENSGSLVVKCSTVFSS